MSSSDYDNIYYDMTYQNYQSTTQEPEQLYFRDTRNNFFLSNPSEYTVSIIRFQLDTYSLPSYIASIQPNQSNPNLMIHSINLSYWNGTTEIVIPPTYLIWIPIHKEVSVPPAPSSNSNGFQSDTNYYYGYSYFHVAEIINTAFKTAMTALNTAVGGGTLNNVDAPFIYYSDTDKTFAIVAEYAKFNINDNTHVRIYFNRPLFALMSSFPVFRYSITNSNNNIYQIRMTGENGYNLIQKTFVGSNKIMIELHQEYPTISNFSPVSSIVFTTTTLPIVPNLMSAPQTFNNNQLLTNSNENNVSAQIITDMSNNDDISYKPNLLYAPSAEFRRITLNSNRPINNIDIKVFWKDKTGKLQPFYLWSGGRASIKLLFEKIKNKGTKLLL